MNKNNGKNIVNFRKKNYECCRKIKGEDNCVIRVVFGIFRDVGSKKISFESL